MDQQGVYIIDQKQVACQPEFIRDELRLGIHCSQYFSVRRIKLSGASHIIISLGIYNN